MARFDKMLDSTDQELQKGLEEFGKSASVLSGTVDKIDKLVSEIESGQGTIGKLLTDESGYQQLNDTIAAGKSAAEDVRNLTRSLNRKMNFIDTAGMWKGYELSYSDLSESLRNQFTISSARSDRFFYMAGLYIREGDLTYHLQAGKNFGNFTVRAGSIRSTAGVGLDYWAIPRRLGVSLEGRDITDRHPDVDLNVAVRLFGGWHFVLGAEDLAGSDVGFNFGFRAEVSQ